MKKLKIILPIAVVAIIGAFVWFWWVDTRIVEEIKPIENPFTKKIQSDIDSLENVSKNVFCKSFYNHIQSGITEFHRDSSLGINYKGSKEIKSAVNNDQWKDILSKNLYSTYVSKFIDQAMYVFNGSEWKDADLNFIRSEVQVLKHSTYLESTSPVANSLNSIIKILAKYDEINGFVSGCNNFKFSDYSIASRYPNVSEKVKKSRAYLANNLDNQYVNKCTRLKNSLQQIPKVLFYKNFGYLIEKI
jgi:hypothetical protein